MKLEAHPSNSATKMLLIGDSGTGKTGALASLAKAGYNLRILDFDAGLDILAQVLRDESDALSRVSFATLTDRLKNVGNRIIPDGLPNAFSRATKLLNHWKDGTEDLGPVTSWTERDVLVIDSMTFASSAALRLVLGQNGRSGQQPQLQDWGEAMRMIEDLLGLLYSDAVRCNVIVTSHIAFVETESGLSKGYPSTLGQKLPPKVGRYFNTVLLTKSVGTGANAKRKIITTSQGLIDLKHPAPGRVPPELPLETGLADFFKILHKETPV